MESRILDTFKDRLIELGPHAAAQADAGLWKHFRLAKDADGVAWLLFDRQGASANTLSAEVIEELDSVPGFARLSLPLTASCTALRT